MPNRKIRVLIAEDNRDDAEVLKVLLQGRTEAQYEVFIANTCKAAEVCLHKEDVDVVLLDLGLPDASGVALVKRIVEAGPRVRIMALTGWCDPEMVEQVKAAGADEYLVKPADPGDISRKLQYLVIRRQFEDERHQIEDVLDGIGKVAIRANEVLKLAKENLRRGDSTY